MAAGFLSYNSFIGFFDIENDKEIQSFKYSVDSFAKINGNLLIFTVKNKLYPVYLENHAKKKEYVLEKNVKKITSIIPLNNEQFIAAADNHKFIYQFNIEGNNKISMIYKTWIDNEIIEKYPKNRLIIYQSSIGICGKCKICLYG